MGQSSVGTTQSSSTGKASTSRSSRCIALIGPYLSGKTTLLEAILARTGAIARQGSVAAKSSIGDASPEARDHGMSVAINVADVSFLGDTFTFVDCPGSIEFQCSIQPASCWSASGRVIRLRGVHVL